MDKKKSRLRRAKRARSNMRRRNATRLTVHRTPTHIYAQIIEGTGGVTVASASSVEKTLRADLKSGGNTDAAVAVGKLIAERAKDKGVDAVAFDRSGFKYHGRVKALADAAREAGLKF